MKIKSLFVLVLLLLSFTPVAVAQAQRQDDTVVLHKSDLTADQLAKAQQDATEKDVQDRVDRYGKWVGVGHELGTAVNESLSAITTQANNFAGTGVGKVTMAVVVYKVIGRDVLGFAIGILMLLIGIPLWWFSFYRNCITRRVVISKTKEETKWELVNALDANSRDRLAWQRWGHVGVIAGFIVLSLIVMFA